ncbi:ATP-binding protein [Desulfobacter latus]|uniref:ATP-binding protein n=1 Tax=Desulfobacter latus TaxID=2292 RepID=A0A850T758_9BACT|nr:ATP-binding protein [Desulfobacter latus]NWH04855.1 ATP-binding protein [Desulfobacter latus]
MNAANMIRLIIDSRLENVSLVGGAVRGIADTLCMDSTTSYQLELCIVEAVNNNIKHAYHCKAGHSVEIDILLYPNRLTFKIYNKGERMNPAKVAPFSFDPSNVETLPEGGMGLYILHALMDEVHYETINGQNILTLVKYLKS